MGRSARGTPPSWVITVCASSTLSKVAKAKPRDVPYGGGGGIWVGGGGIGGGKMMKGVVGLVTERRLRVCMCVFAWLYFPPVKNAIYLHTTHARTHAHTHIHTHARTSSFRARTRLVTVPKGRRSSERSSSVMLGCRFPRYTCRGRPGAGFFLGVVVVVVVRDGGWLVCGCVGVWRGQSLPEGRRQASAHAKRMTTSPEKPKAKGQTHRGPDGWWGPRGCGPWTWPPAWPGSSSPPATPPP